MNKLILLVFIVMMIISCTKTTIIEVATVGDGYLGEYRVVYTDRQLGSKRTLFKYFYTLEGVNTFILESDINLSSWEVDHTE